VKEAISDKSVSGVLLGKAEQVQETSVLISSKMKIKPSTTFNFVKGLK